VVEIASRTDTRPITATALAAVSGVSLSHVEQLAPPLLRHGILKSALGPGGGYSLAKPPEAISVADVLRAVKHKPSARSRQPAEGGECPANDSPLPRSFRHEIDRVLQLVLDSISIADVIAGGFEHHPFLSKYWRYCDTYSA
jgi:Rrf2 family iron-sulfur cluster assembly transcriptional regulator